MVGFEPWPFGLGGYRYRSTSSATTSVHWTVGQTLYLALIKPCYKMALVKKIEMDNWKWPQLFFELKRISQELFQDKEAFRDELESSLIEQRRPNSVQSPSKSWERRRKPFSFDQIRSNFVEWLAASAATKEQEEEDLTNFASNCFWERKTFSAENILTW